MKHHQMMFCWSKSFICFLLCLLLLFDFLQSSSSSSEEFVAVNGYSHGGFEAANHGDEDGEEDEVFGDEKRKVHTGPNPLHNR
ncbi:CLAVATA3/ESR-RELATED 14 [Hibiscus trionum]|uniref:CLAVATA3/ESR-RELATED 14 n=1 Tax=Hibiscus trionum TaxID=183268 RepID=A0A9W7HB75_HIBTR|nr:CLAVATA3/ESR-RELATED 14 [Hibiscus trionum]